MKEPEVHINSEIMRRITTGTIESAAVVVRKAAPTSSWCVSLTVSGKNLFKDLTIAHAWTKTEEDARNIGAVLRDLCLMKKGVD